MACMFYFARCINIICNSLLVQLVKYDVHTSRKIKFIQAICYHILLLLNHFIMKSVCMCVYVQPVKWSRACCQSRCGALSSSSSVSVLCSFSFCSSSSSSATTAAPSTKCLRKRSGTERREVVWMRKTSSVNMLDGWLSARSFWQNFICGEKSVSIINLLSIETD